MFSFVECNTFNIVFMITIIFCGVPACSIILFHILACSGIFRYVPMFLFVMFRLCGVPVFWCSVVFPVFQRIPTCSGVTNSIVRLVVTYRFVGKLSSFSCFMTSFKSFILIKASLKLFLFLDIKLIFTHKKISASTFFWHISVLSCFGVL